MDAFIVSVFYVLIWRLCVLACGLVCVILGYRLFMGGFAAQQGSVEAGVGGNTLKMSNMAPGTFFAFFGAVIIATLVWTSPAEIVVPKEALQATAQVDMGPGGLTVRSEE
ncbi:MAG: hypothetical protein HY899_16335 [Deltaproteobacteria bacterium]|nr:hypothetical protein [Deltaproteobacteria bacterium]